ncbi:hypothetical protein ACFV4N_18985 [Actinosynnema sp. NPDC059797]
MSRSVRLAMAALLALGAVVGGTSAATAGDDPESITVEFDPAEARTGTAQSQDLRLFCRYTYTPARDAVVSANCYHTGVVHGLYMLTAMCGDGSWVVGQPSVYGSSASLNCPGSFGVRLVRMVPMR